MKHKLDLEFFGQGALSLLESKKNKYEYNEAKINTALMLWIHIAMGVTIIKIAVKNPELKNKEAVIQQAINRVIYQVSQTHAIENYDLISSKIKGIVRDHVNKVESIDEYLMCAMLGTMYLQETLSPNEIIAAWKEYSEIYFTEHKLAKDELLKFNNELLLWGKAIEENANDSKFCKSNSRRIFEKIPLILALLALVYIIWDFPNANKEMNQIKNNKDKADPLSFLKGLIQLIVASVSLIFIVNFAKLNLNRYVLLEKDIRLKMAFMCLKALITRNFENIPEITSHDSHEKSTNELSEKDIKIDQIKPKLNFFKPVDFKPVYKNNSEEKNSIIKLENSEESRTISEEIISKKKIKTRGISDITKDTKLKNEQEIQVEQNQDDITIQYLSKIYKLKENDFINLSNFGENTFGYWNRPLA